MSHINSTIIIAERILELEADTAGNAHRLRRSLLPEFGDEGSDLREVYERFLVGYRHERVKIVGEDKEVLGLIPPSAASGPAYVEIDDWANPIPISEEGLKAVELVESLIRDEKGHSLEVAESIGQIVNYVKTETLSLKMAIFERLWNHFAAQETGTSEQGGSIPMHGLPSQFFHLLPWRDRFNKYLESLNELLPSKPRPIDKLNPTQFVKYHNRVEKLISKREEERASRGFTLPILGHYFAYFCPGLAPALSNLIDSIESWAFDPQERLNPLLSSVRMFIFKLRKIRLDYIPEDTRKLLATFVSRLATFLEGLRGRNLNAYQVDEVARSICFARLLFMKLREIAGKLDPQGRLFDLSRALIAADRASSFDQKPWYIGPLLRELRVARDRIPEEPDVLLEDKSFKRDWEISDGLINAADILRFYAEILFEWEKQPGNALKSLEISERYYNRAKAFIAQKGRVYKRYARALILKTDILASLDKRDEALNAHQDAIRHLDEFFDEDYEGEEDDVMEYYSRIILETQAHFALLKYFSGYETLESQVEENLKYLISESEHSKDAKAYQMLYEYYDRLKGDIESALKILDFWADSWRKSVKDSPARRKSVDWFQYSAARRCAMAASSNPSFAYQAVTRYVQVLQDQPNNTRATEDLIELLDKLPEDQFIQAYQLLKKNFTPVEAEDCPLTHAILRVLFCGEGPLRLNRIDSPAQALVVIVRGPDEILDQAKDILVEIGLTKYLHITLELLSKWYFEQGRLNPFGDELGIADRILDLSLQILDRSAQTEKDKKEHKKDKVIWMTRKLDIALSNKDFETAAYLALQLNQDFPDDPIVKLKTAILMIKEGKLTEADKILREAAVVEAESEETQKTHPAILDRRAYVAFRLDRFPEAGNLYRKILEENPFDPTARFGLGRVYFEQGHDQWVNAFDEWLRVLRIRTRSDSQHDNLLANLTARSIASLCEKSLHDSKPEASTSNIGDKILTRLSEVIHSENSRVSSMLIDSLGDLGIVDRQIVGAVLKASKASKDLGDVFLTRRIAQYLMARTVYANLNVKNGGFDPNEIVSYIEWCKGKMVLPEYLAGAKGSYGRVLLRLVLHKRDLCDLLDYQQISAFKESLRGDLYDLYNHICTVGYSEFYYQEAYRLFGRVGDRSPQDWAQFTEGLVKAVAFRIWESSPSMEDLINGLSFAKSLWPLKDILNVQDGTSVVGGWVDWDVLSVAQQTFGGNGWRLVGSEIEREVSVSSLPRGRQVLAYSKSGLFFRQEPNNQKGEKFYCYIETLPDFDLQPLHVSWESD